MLQNAAGFKVSAKQFKDYLWDENLICLCEMCHRLAHPDELIQQMVAMYK